MGCPRCAQCPQSRHVYLFLTDTKPQMGTGLHTPAVGESGVEILSAGSSADMHRCSCFCKPILILTTLNKYQGPQIPEPQGFCSHTQFSCCQHFRGTLASVLMCPGGHQSPVSFPASDLLLLHFFLCPHGVVPFLQASAGIA